MTCIMHAYFREYTEYTPIFLSTAKIQNIAQFSPTLNTSDARDGGIVE